jgi:hypothetical protein
MSGDVLIPGETQRYEAVLRISDALFVCQQREELARILANQLGELLSFDHLDLVIFKENPKEIKWRAWGKGRLGVLEPPVEELPTWQLYDSLETLLVRDWNTDERLPSELTLVSLEFAR